MKQRLLGTSGLRVSELCLGTSNFDATGIYEKTGVLDQEAANHLVGEAMDAGINFFNTAEVYSDGNAEIALGKALGKRRGDAIVITKVHPKRIPGYDRGHSRTHIVEGCHASLKRLGTDYIDILELHFFDPDTPLEVTIRAMDDLVRSGKVRYIGCSNFSGWQLMKGLAISERRGWEKFTTLESMYSLVCRDLEYEVIPACIDQGVAFLAFSPLHGGYLAGKYRRDQPLPQGTRFDRIEQRGPWAVEPAKLFDIVDVLDLIAANHEATVSQAALNYVLRKPGVCSLIVGARNAAQLYENVKATEWEMTEDEFLRLDALSMPARKYPYEVFDPLKAPPDA